MKKIFLVFPNQLFVIKKQFIESKYIALIEDNLFFGCDSEWKQKFHCQKIIFHIASMSAYKEDLRKQDYHVIYINHKRDIRTEQNLNYLLTKGFNYFITYEPFDWSLEKRIKNFCSKNKCNLKIVKNEMSLTNNHIAEETIKQEKIHGIQNFYKKQRKDLNILIEHDGSPTQGNWNFDKMNRKKLPRGIEVPSEPIIKTNKFLEKAKNDASTNYPDYYGNHESFNYPVTHKDAEEWLEKFLIERFNKFGDYEDAISSKHKILWHSVLSPLLNTGLLTPKKILDITREFYQTNQIGINSYEGFIRQIIGWREFILIIYKRNNIQLRNGNFWGFEDKPIPSSFYTGNTGIRPLDDSIKNVLETGYAHHIERLMIIGNLMLLCRFHPNQVYKWFMELFIDSYDWVMVPNVYGMSQFSNGGLFTTKPYISGSNYIKKMSNYKSEDWCETWDSLFWTFVDDYKNIFKSQNRLSMIVRNLEKMDINKKIRHRKNADEFLKRLS
ncbi:cryptochrome/photolyase family protein [Prochlorococcus marinus]|uniref:cryptochrome/photolyase family protein n=1 Tax=Prochlorococcus marinus TaxID=1219 RepID=UPI001C56154E|nr:cryptochrome/photolyase family protein [Prochlorococcus marinus]MBW3042337.1 cryptochrome/photolyase family protein [Prochlorococcus marinus str. XMU1408]